MRRASTLAKEEIATNKVIQIRALCQLDSCQQRQNRMNTIVTFDITNRLRLLDQLKVTGSCCSDQVYLQGILVPIFFVI